MELPECPVCLQSYDDRDAVPRVLSCGHSVCEACLVELPQRYPNTIRCPACTQLVKYPSQQGPSSLPKNIDLLRLCLQHSPSSHQSRKPNQRTVNADYDRSPFWSHEFYTAWKDWILPHDAVLIDEHGFGQFCSSSSCKGRVCFGVNRRVSLVPVVCFPPGNCSKFKFSYVAWVIKCLEGMNEDARGELALIIEASVRQGRVCSVYGLWSEGVDGNLYLVCERHRCSLLDKFDQLRNGFVGVNGDGSELDRGGIFSFAMIGLGVCESVLALNLEGLFAGYLGLSCFSLDELGGICVDLSEALIRGRKFVEAISDEDKEEAICKVENEVFMSPEVLCKLLHKEAITPDSGHSRYGIGYGSDVWSLACVLLQLLIGNASVLEEKLRSEYQSLRQTLCKCLNINPGSRPDVVDVRKCIQDMLVKPEFDFLDNLEVTLSGNKKGCCLVLGELCQLPKESSKKSRDHELQEKEDGAQPDFVQYSKDKPDEDFVAGLSEGITELKDLRGHLDCISGLAVGGMNSKIFHSNDYLFSFSGGYLFSSSFDKTVHVWSLQDFSHLHTFRGHENKVMALVYVDNEEPLCISGDSGGGIFIWGIVTPLRQDPLRKWYEKKDWRFSGIHSLAVSRNLCLYTGSGDRTIKAWSLKDGTLICTMTGHRSVVSTLAICDEVLYSGSWDGTVRLWSLNDHSPLTFLGEDMLGEMKSILAITVDRHFLVAGYENGCIKVWRNDVFMNSKTLHNGAIFALSMQGNCLYTGGWDKNVNIQENVGRVQKRFSDFASLNYWVVRDYYRLVNSVNAFEPHIQVLSDEQLAAKTPEFRRRLARGDTLADIQAEAFAVVREAARRKLGMRHFDVQIIGGAVLHDGSIAEMKTGEGKTLVSTLAAYLNALTSEGVHVVTVNDYLAQRDAEWMGRVHRFLGLSVGLVQRGMDAEERRFNYGCDITYTNNSELGFDYLRDNLAGNSEQLVMRWPKPFHFAIVDEVDSVLIDEGRNPLLISGEASKDAARYPVAAKVAELLIRGIHYKVELKDNSVELTEEGIALAEMALETKDLWDENDPWARFVMNALKAKEFYRRDVQYIVRDGKALIINELTGRVEEKRRWSEGIHQAVEAKEGLKIQADSVVVAQITYQSLFKLYPKLSGMTGTAKTEEKEFLKMFQMPVIEVPTNLPNIRKDLPIQAFATARGKWEQVRREVEYMFRQGRPVLVGTTSVENSELLSGLLREWNIPHNVLNARPKYAAREAEIVAQAGRKHAITISTNMAGRGTDIILGGNPKMLAREIIEDSLLSFLTQEDPNVELADEAISQKVLPKIKVGSSSLALLAKTALMAKYVSKSEGNSWTYQKAKSFILEAVEMSLSYTFKELDKLANEESDIYPLGPSVALAYLSVLKDCEEHCMHEGSEVKRLGGLHVIGTSLHESRRIDNQLRGRAGRQGDPGSTRFMVSLQDEMFQKFNFDTEWAVRLISKITNDEDLPIEGDAIVKQLLALQINAEKFFFGIRKNLVEFDEVLEVQRKHVYDLRQLILTGDDESCSQHIFQYMQAVVDEIVFSNIDPLKHPCSWGLSKLLKEFMTVGGKLLHGISDDTLLNSLGLLNDVSSVDVVNFSLTNLPPPPNAFRGIRRKSSSLRRWLAICSDDVIGNGKYRTTSNLLRKYLGDFLIASYLNVVEESGYDDRHVKDIERAVLLKTLDCFWRDHLVNMNRLSSAVNVRSFGHRNPLEEYKIDGCRFFISMLSATRRLTVEALLKYWTSPMESQELFL
ncbi:protein translocase subunit SECA2, chloroplastic isoform X2 [Abrus precatorius]|uniref:Protein translocase subunit SecA n=1 Tax=Abrus precatorius TaxID=3816 RepID=A0A8B8K7Y9_ABRPR|nr:protein translocase subunit SECA2, chloroplastic isoform X2 [Abrus precatorius]